MAVTLSSDLLVGVLQAAPKDQAAMAGRKLNALALGKQFGGHLEALGPAGADAGQPDIVSDVMTAARPEVRDAAAARLSALGDGPEPDRLRDAYQGLEAALVSTMFDAMTPQPDEGESGFAQGVWRGMAVGQYASLFTRAGGLGLADQLADRYHGAVPIEDSWPYFSTRQIVSFAG